MAIPLFVTGIGTGVGKTLASAILAEALEADYWKPVQTGVPESESDSAYVGARLSNSISRVHPECYQFALPASPHAAARAEHVEIDLDFIAETYRTLPTENEFIVVEGAGGIMVPLNQKSFMGDLAQRLGAKVILVSRNYLGSINHSLLTARVCKELGLDIAGWIFNDHFGDYEEEIRHWSGYPILASIPLTKDPDSGFIAAQAQRWGAHIKAKIGKA